MNMHSLIPDLNSYRETPIKVFVCFTNHRCPEVDSGVYSHWDCPAISLLKEHEPLIMESPSALFSTYPVCAHLPIPTGNEATVDVHFIPAQLVHIDKIHALYVVWHGKQRTLLLLWSFHEYLAVCSSINAVYRNSPTSYVPSSRNRGHGHYSGRRIEN